MIRWKKTAWLLVMLCVLASGLFACRRTPDEEQVRVAIAAATAATEAGAASDVVAPLSDDFDGNGGELDRRMLANMVRLVGLRGDHIGVAIGPIAIEHRGERMVATFTVTLTSGGRLLPEQMGLYRVESAWRKENRAWRCYTASWTHAL